MKKSLAAGALLALGMPVAAQDAPQLEFAFEERVTLGEPILAGKTARGERLIYPITGGTFEGPNLRGEVLPMGWDWQLRRDDGCTEVEADYFIRTDDGVIINVVNEGVICRVGEQDVAPVRTQPVFEAPLGKYDWLSKSGFLGTLEPEMDGDKVAAVRIRFYRAR